MKHLISISFILLLLLNSNIFSNYGSYLPMQVGNKWFYGAVTYNIGIIRNDKVKIEVTGTATLNGKQYFECTRTIQHISGNGTFGVGLFTFQSTITYIRIDQTSGNVYYHSPSQYCSFAPFEIMTDSLASKLNDTSRINCIQYPYFYICTDTLNKKNFFRIYGFQPEIRLHRTYTRDAGLSFSYYSQGGGTGSYSATQTLSGRVINGMAFGDTSFAVTSVSPVSGILPDKFELSQNYPNPFNPQTNIRFELPEASLVILKVYNSIGEDISTLANEELRAGVYEVDFDASNLPSGMYYYRITAGNYTQTKKMVLVK